MVETTTNHPKGRALAHILDPKMKSPKKIDADGYKRKDNKPINGHIGWWKIVDVSTADIFETGGELHSIVIYKSAVPDNEFGPVKFLEGESWGDRIQYIVKVRKNRKGTITAYFVEGKDWIEKEDAVKMVKNGEIDNATIVRPKKGKPFLKAFPSQPQFGDMEA